MVSSYAQGIFCAAVLLSVHSERVVEDLVLKCVSEGEVAYKGAIYLV